MSRVENLKEITFKRNLSYSSYDPKDLVSLRRVCKEFRRFASVDQLWEKQIKKNYPHLLKQMKVKKEQEQQKQEEQKKEKKTQQQSLSSKPKIP